MSAELATVSFRTESGVVEGESWTLVDSATLSHTVPWRTFRWYKGHGFSGPGNPVAASRGTPYAEWLQESVPCTRDANRIIKVLGGL